MVEQVGRYKIKGQLGRGAMGVVYLADDPLLNRQAAIKTVDLAADDAGQREFLRTRLLRDARAAAGLTHPNIVGVFDVVEEGDSAYLVMEYVAGETLAAALDRRTIPDPAFTVRVLRDMAAALDYTHARGIVHRDIKPANVMIDPTQTAKIMDFGIARIADTRTMTPTGMVMGTIEYMSPEQVKGEAVDGRSDQFALASVAYRMLTGATLYGQHSLATLAYKIVNEAPPKVRMRNAGLPSSVDAVVSKALAKTPDERYATCTEFVEALAAGLAEPRRDEPTLTMQAPQAVPVMAAPQGTPAAPAPPAPPAKKSRSAAIALAALLVLAGAGLAIWRPWNKPEEPPAAPKTTADITAPKESPAASKATPDRPGGSTPAAGAVVPGKNPAAKPEPVQSEPTRSGPGKSDPKNEKTPADLLDETATGVENTVQEPAPAQTPRPAVEAYKSGMDLLNAKQFGPAIEAFTKAISLRPNWPNPLLDRGRAYQMQGDCTAAIRDLDQFLEERPKNAFGHAYRGTCYARFHDDDRALTDFNAAIAQKPDAVLALYGRAMVHMRKGGYRVALNDFNTALSIAPKYEAAYQGRGQAKVKLNDRAGADADFRRARELHVQ
jgi:serine/threonine protein kinase/Flp pilus assembly protein TadD